MSALDIGIDLGTTKTIIYKDKNKFVLNEPSLVAVDIKKDEVLAIGNEAFKMFERTPPNIKVVYPLRDGVVSNHELTKVLLKECLKKASSSYLVKHKVMICVPSFVTNVEKRTLIEVVSECGAQKVYLLEEPVAAAIGSGLDISKANGNMIVDIGGGTVDIAVISMSGVVHSASVKYAGNKIDEEIVKLFFEKYKIL
ncbi:MAG: rod shape-determining protein, partial [Oscillospiraceae bacterium]